MGRRSSSIDTGGDNFGIGEFTQLVYGILGRLRIPLPAFVHIMQFAQNFHHMVKHLLDLMKMCQNDNQ